MKITTLLFLFAIAFTHNVIAQASVVTTTTQNGYVIFTNSTGKRLLVVQPTDSTLASYNGGTHVITITTGSKTLRTFAMHTDSILPDGGATATNMLNWLYFRRNNRMPVLTDAQWQALPDTSTVGLFWFNSDSDKIQIKVSGHFIYR